MAAAFRTPAGKAADVPLFASIVRSAGAALNNAIDLYAQPKNYAQLIVNGLAEVKKLSWERAAGKYLQVYDVASTRGR